MCFSGRIVNNVNKRYTICYVGFSADEERDIHKFLYTAICVIYVMLDIDQENVLESCIRTSAFRFRCYAVKAFQVGYTYEAKDTRIGFLCDAVILYVRTYRFYLRMRHCCTSNARILINFTVKHYRNNDRVVSINCVFCL